MNDQSKDAGVIAALMQRLEQKRLPRALELKKKVEQGELLADVDISFLEEVFADTNKIQPLIDRHPEYGDLVTRMTCLYKEITSKALENEKRDQ